MRGYLFSSLVVLAACGQGPILVTPDAEIAPEVAALAALIPDLVAVQAGWLPIHLEDFKADDANVCGSYSGIDIKVYAWCENSLYIVAHELGHVLGLKHSEDTKSLMFRRVQSGWTIDEIVASLRAELLLQAPKQRFVVLEN